MVGSYLVIIALFNHMTIIRTIVLGAKKQLLKCHILQSVVELTIFDVVKFKYLPLDENIYNTQIYVKILILIYVKLRTNYI